MWGDVRREDRGERGWVGVGMMGDADCCRPVLVGKMQRNVLKREDVSTLPTTERYSCRRQELLSICRETG